MSDGLTDNRSQPESCSVCGERGFHRIGCVNKEIHYREELKDSGQRREFKSGAVRDMAEGKGSFDLIQVHGVLLSALQLERGKAKYGSRNWEKGQPLSCYADSALRHLLKAIAGYDDEPHLDAAIWNLMCWAEGAERIKQGIWPAELDDMPKTYQGKTPPF